MEIKNYFAMKLRRNVERELSMFEEWTRSDAISEVNFITTVD